MCLYFHILKTFVCLKSLQSCPTLCNPMNCSLAVFPVHGDSPGKNTGVGCHSLLQGIFLTQGSNPGLLHCRKILYHLKHQGSPWTLLQYFFYFKDNLTFSMIMYNFLHFSLKHKMEKVMHTVEN